jgi:hypothetical protein
MICIIGNIIPLTEKYFFLDKLTIILIASTFCYFFVRIKSYYEKLRQENTNVTFAYTFCPVSLASLCVYI